MPVSCKYLVVYAVSHIGWQLLEMVSGNTNLSLSAGRGIGDTIAQGLFC